MPSPETPRRKRLFWKILAGLVLVVTSLLISVPWLLATPPARRWIQGRVDRVMTPNRLRFESIRIPWFRSISLSRIELITKDGSVVATVPRAFWDRGLFDLLTDSRNLGTLSLVGANLAVERRADGSIDLIEALTPLLKPDARRELRVKVVDGSLKASGLGLIGPVAAERVGLDLKLPADLRPLSWQLNLSTGSGDASSLDISGQAGRGAGASGQLPDIDATLTARSWPLAFAGEGFVGSGRLDGKASARRDAGFWKLSGTSQITALEAGSQKAGLVRGAWDRLQGNWQVSQTIDGWMTGPEDRVDLASTGDLGKLAKFAKPWAGEPIEEFGGGWSLKTSMRGEDRKILMAGELVASDVSWGRAGSGDVPPIAMSWRASMSGNLNRLDLEALRLTGGNSSFELAGRVEDLMGARNVDLAGTLIPDWAGINSFLTERVERGALVQGKSGAVRLKGRLSGATAAEIGGGFDAEAGLNLDGAKLFGMTLGRVPLSLRLDEGQVTFGPIRTTLNGGTLHLDPELVTDERASLSVRLKPGSGLEDAEINDEVSRRVLAYVAPVLDAATRAHGKVSADIQRAEFPIGGGASRQALVEGHVIFRDTEFVPGPLVEQLVQLVGRRDARPVRLDQPVVLSIADGRVHQRGLSLPLGPVARVELEGSVGFDRTLDLRASVPLSSEILADRPMLNRLAAGTRIEVPIGGTLDRPKIDKDAFSVALRQTGQDLLQRGLGLGAAGLLEKMLQPRAVDPNAPPPPTAEERRVLREERKADRLRRRAERRGEALP